MFFIGVDIGQKRDHTAIAVVERRDTVGVYGSAVEQGMGWLHGVSQAQAAYAAQGGDAGAGPLGVRLVERVPLGTSYPEVVERVREVAADPELRGGGGCSLVVDATGVGAPVVDLLRVAGLRCELTAVTITSGEREQQGEITGRASVAGMARWNVPKRDLMTGLQVLLEQGELGIARGLEEAGTLSRELLDVRVTMKNGGRFRMGADGHGEHDDLVIAVALACWGARRKRNGWGEGRLV